MRTRLSKKMLSVNLVQIASTKTFLGEIHKVPCIEKNHPLAILEFSQLQNSNLSFNSPFLEWFQYDHLVELADGFVVLHGARLVLVSKFRIPDFSGRFTFERVNLSVQLTDGIVYTFRP